MYLGILVITAVLVVLQQVVVLNLHTWQERLNLVPSLNLALSLTWYVYSSTSRGGPLCGVKSERYPHLDRHGHRSIRGQNHDYVLGHDVNAVPGLVLALAHRVPDHLPPCQPTAPGSSRSRLCHCLQAHRRPCHNEPVRHPHDGALSVQRAW